MHARTTLLEIDTLRVSVDEAVATFERSVLPRLSAQVGFRGVFALANPDGHGMLLTFWDTADQADAAGATGWYADVLDEFVTLFRSPPGRERYEVRVAVPALVSEGD